jgi:hypothetical protein
VLTFGAFLLASIAVSLLLRFAQRRHGQAIGLGRISPIPAVRDGLSSRPAAAARPARAGARYPDFPKDVRPEEIHVVYPTPAEAEAGLEQLRRCVAQWRGQPALLVADPDVAMIVRLNAVMQDALGFQLRLRVEEVIGAPAGFDAAAGLDLACGWNQPYMSFDERAVSAPYCFYLHFGETGVSNVRELWSQMRSCDAPYTSLLRGTFRRCFSSGLREPARDGEAARAIGAGSGAATAPGSSGGADLQP